MELKFDLPAELSTQGEAILAVTETEIEWIAQRCVDQALDYKTAELIVDARRAVRASYEAGYQAGLEAGAALPHRKVVERDDDGRIVALREVVDG